MGLLHGKTGLVLGLANDKSVAWGVASQCREQGAEVYLTYQNDATRKRVEPLAERLAARAALPCEVTSDASIDALFDQLVADDVRLDFVVHSLAFADKDALARPFSETTREQFRQALDISAYSLIAIAQRFARLPRPPEALVTMSYLGAVRAVPGYNVMGVAKAALEANVRYLAQDLGAQGTRVNAISAGPLRTLASSAIKGFKSMLNASAEAAPLKRAIDIHDVGRASVYLVSDLSQGVTGEVHYVDAGYNTTLGSLGAP